MKYTKHIVVWSESSVSSTTWPAVRH